MPSWADLDEHGGEAMMRSSHDMALALLVDATATQAQQDAVRVRAETEARRAEEREQRREAANQLVLRRRRERRDRLRRIRRQSLGLLMAGAPIWLLIPIVGSFLSAADDNVSRVIFLNGDTGDTAGSGPGTLYLMSAELLIGMVAALTIIALLLPYPNGKEVISGPAIGGFAIGTLILVVQAFSGSGSAMSWCWAPLLAVLAHCVYGLYRRTLAAAENLGAAE
ncbi:hypothetical protein [Nocardia vaccinii]|uniref:hypothetical protein n=1 Tax=Nocardia vaccinii TaxID=1822 RepID=UPI000835DBC5|nr:hypothetical protein [Nocardia vaccinii]